MQTLFVHMKLLANHFLLCIYQGKMCTKIYCVYVMPLGFEDDPMVAQNIRCLWRGGEAAVL